MPHVCVPVTQEIFDVSMGYAKDCLPYEFDRFGLTDDERLLKIFIGTVGELAFKAYLEKTPLAKSVEFNLLVGQYDEYDFRIRGKKIDLKVSGFQDSYDRLNLLYATEPYSRRHYDFVVQGFVDGYIKNEKRYILETIKNVYFPGFIQYDNIKNFPKINFGYALDFKVPIASLIDINDLEKHLGG